MGRQDNYQEQGALVLTLNLDFKQIDIFKNDNYEKENTIYNAVLISNGDKCM